MNNQKRLRDIKGTKLFQDFERYAQEVKASLFRNDEEKTLDEESIRICLLERFARLELSRKDWEEVKAYSVERTADRNKFLNAIRWHSRRRRLSCRRSHKET
jgi:hypothetical protein